MFAKCDKDQYQRQLKALETLRQTGSVVDYQAQFEKLAHGILLYNPSYDVYFITRFLAGLKEEIRAPIALQRPRDVDTTSALGLLQKEELVAAKNKPFGRAFLKGANKAPDKLGMEKQAMKFQKPDADDKLATLKQYHCKNGLCFKCGGKWGPTHSCTEHVPLHVLEELWDASDESVDVQSETLTAEDSVCALQLPRFDKSVRRNTLKLLAHTGKHQVLVLVYSGSVGTL